MSDLKTKTEVMLREAIDAHNKMEAYCNENNLKAGLSIEEYVNAETAVSEDELITNIYYLVTEK